MFRIGELKAFSQPMSNYSVYFLSQSANLYTNCSVYSLISGQIMAQDFDSQVWQNNSLDFLPAYYVTNCSISDLVQQIRDQNSTADDVAAWFNNYYTNPYNVADNGDSFVALSYMLSGSCVSCWMLMFLILLSPKHKRKPLLTQSAMLVYSSVLSAIFFKVTRVARDQYYKDSLDLVRLLSLTAEKPFTISLAISEFLTNLAFLQLTLKLSRHKWGTFNRWFVSFLSVACLVVYSVLISRVKMPTTFVTATYDTYRSGHMSLNIVFMAWFAGNLGYYTACGTATAPRQVSYARKLLPLASLTWFNIALYLIVSILLLSIWSETWLVNVWVSFGPTLLKMYILITSWEWLYSIRHLEQKLELGDVLGRRISVDDVEAFNNDKNVKSALFQSRFSSVLNFLCGSTHSESLTLKPCTTDGASLTHSARTEYRTSACESRTSSRAEASHDELRDDASYQEVQMDNADIWGESEDEIASRPVDHDSRRSIILTNGSHIEEPTIQVGSSRVEAEEPPSFTPHPGYHVDDYWEEKGPAKIDT